MQWPISRTRGQIALADSERRCQPRFIAGSGRRNKQQQQEKRLTNCGKDRSMTTVNFDAPDLARRIEQLSQAELDELPFGVILLDRDGIVKFYSQTEARQSGYGKLPLGQNFFALSRCMAGDSFHGRITRAMEAGPVDLEFGWAGDFADPKREMRIRVQSARQGGVWVMVERDPAAPASAA
jgi:photoactive yellow protein